MPRKPIDAEIVRHGSPAVQQLQTQVESWKQRALIAENRLLELQRIEALGNIESNHREKQIRHYYSKIEQLNLQTQGGLRCCPIAEEGEDQELVNEAWWIFLDRHSRGARARF